ncbi:hypothetical protein D3C80_1247730 [compost metagenome]
MAQALLALGFDILGATGRNQLFLFFFLEPVLPGHGQLRQRLLHPYHALLVLRIGIDMGNAGVDNFYAEQTELLLLAQLLAVLVELLFNDETRCAVVAKTALFGAGLQDCSLRWVVVTLHAYFLAAGQVQAIAQLVFELGTKVAAVAGVVVVGAHEGGCGL